MPPDNRKGHDHDRSKAATTTVSPARDLSHSRQECAGKAQEMAEAAKRGGIEARVSDLTRQHKSVERYLEQRAKAANSPERTQSYERIKDAVREVQERQKADLKTCAENFSKLQKSMAEAVDRLEAISERQIEDLTRRGPAASAEAPELAEHLSRQIGDLQDRVRAAGEMQKSHESRLANLMSKTQEALLEAVAAEATKADTSREALGGADLINKVLADADQDIERLNRDWRGAVVNLENSLRAIEARLTPESLDQVRDIVKDSPLADLDEAAFEQVVAAALEGQENRASLDAAALAESIKAAATRIKGQLLEEGLRPLAEAEAREFSAKLGRQVEYIEGHRIRDENNHKISDGLLAWRDQNDVLNVVRVYEAKAGEPAARRLNEEIAKLTKEDRKEAEKYAEDLAIEQYAEDVKLRNGANEEVANLKFREATGPVAEDLAGYKKKAMLELESRDARRDLGQKQRTIERLDESRIYVDGKASKVAPLGISRMRAVLPEDVRHSEVDAVRVRIRAEDLKKLADQILARLRRDGVFS